MKKYVFLTLFVLVIAITGFVVQKNSNLPSRITLPTEQSVRSQEKQAIQTKYVLDLSNKNLKSIPSYVFNETSVEELDISNNQLTGSIPAEINRLTALKILDASNNAMTGLPAEIGQLAQLEFLDVSNNKLTGLPYELGNLKKLKILNLSDNDYSKQDLDIIRKNLPSDVKIITE